MYRRIKIPQDDRCFKKILWRWNNQEPIKVYLLNTVTYGTSSAPFQATRSLIELVDTIKSQFPQTSSYQTMLLHG